MSELALNHETNVKLRVLGERMLPRPAGISTYSPPVLALAAAGTLGTTAALTLQHGVMIPAMLGVMLWRYQEYSHRH